MKDIKEKAKKFYEDHKLLIGYVAGATVAITSMWILEKISHKSGGKTFYPNKKAEFPIEMPVAEIKDALRKVEGAKIYDALLVTRGKITSMFVREAI